MSGSTPNAPPQRSRLLAAFLAWFDNSKAQVAADDAGGDRVDWTRILPFVAMHLACLLAFVVGASPVAVLNAASEAPS